MRRPWQKMSSAAPKLRCYNGSGENNSGRLAQSRLKFRQNVTSGASNIDLFDVYKIFYKYHLGNGPGMLTKRYCGVGLNAR
jgi:hypothetical protein